MYSAYLLLTAIDHKQILCVIVHPHSFKEKVHYKMYVLRARARRVSTSRYFRFITSDQGTPHVILLFDSHAYVSFLHQMNALTLIIRLLSYKNKVVSALVIRKIHKIIQINGLIRFLETKIGLLRKLLSADYAYTLQSSIVKS